MNELIKRIAEQATKNIEFVAGQYHDKLDAEKFAELIVKECAQFVEAKFDFCGDEIIVAESILKHFGIKDEN